MCACACVCERETDTGRGALEYKNHNLACRAKCYEGDEVEDDIEHQQVEFGRYVSSNVHMALVESSPLID